MYREALDSQTSFGLSRVRDWALETGGICDDDIFISADVDEIMSREALHKLQWCETSADVISGALWMPMGNLRKALRSHFPVLGRPHTFSMPTIYKWKSIKENKFDGKRLFNLTYTGKYVSGGLHMTNNAFIPTALLKELSATEDDFYSGFINTDFLFSMTAEDLAREQDRLYNFQYQQCLAEFSDEVEMAPDVEQYVPWYLDCNKVGHTLWYLDCNKVEQTLWY